MYIYSYAQHQMSLFRRHNGYKVNNMLQEDERSTAGIDKKLVMTDQNGQSPPNRICQLRRAFNEVSNELQIAV